MAVSDALALQSTVNSRTWRVLAWGGVALQAFAFVAVWWLQRWNGLWTIGGFFVASLAFMLLQDRIPSLISFIVVCAAIVNAGGWAWNWYNQFIWFDEFVHTFTSFAGIAAITYRLATANAVLSTYGPSSLVLVAASVGLGLGIAWEIAESLFLDLKWTDTLVDLLVDTIGAALGGWFAVWAIQNHTDSMLLSAEPLLPK